MLSRKIILALLLAFILSVQANAQAGPKNDDTTLISELSVYKVVNAETDSTVMLKADTLKPGNIIEYHLSYKNNSSEVLYALKPTLPIPQELVLTEKQASGESLLWVSKNNNEYMIYDSVKEGKENKIVENEERNRYRSIRWNIEKLNPAEEIALIARMRVL